MVLRTFNEAKKKGSGDTGIYPHTHKHTLPRERGRMLLCMCEHKPIETEPAVLKLPPKGSL